MKKCIVFLVLLLLVTACSSDEQPGKSSNAVTAETQASTPVAEPATSQESTPGAETGTRQVASHKIIFFLNPNGSPCRQQLSILNDMAEELRGAVDIQYVATSVPGDRALFSQYGIRGLPTLLLAEASGKEISRMPPGVKQAADIRLLIKSIPQS